MYIASLSAFVETTNDCMGGCIYRQPVVTNNPSVCHTQWAPARTKQLYAWLFRLLYKIIGSQSLRQSAQPYLFRALLHVQALKWVSRGRRTRIWKSGSKAIVFISGGAHSWDVQQQWPTASQRWKDCDAIPPALHTHTREGVHLGWKGSYIQRKSKTC